ncbi:class I SAM-dependent methyltransferase [Halorientalis brevis]|uniref:Class I SAM-dependent methyltransferase n=1 Tax=Halorientalis brevis TaxID=1126241 RepID=A0ABD6C9H2_9EURY|nr:methyltransferase domain-containing protein [Halorientalis brevis]
MTGGSESTNRWNAADYDDDHAFVFEYGESLLDRLDPQSDERVLDLGCGTGHLTAEIADRGATVLGVDQSAAMIREARESYPDLAFERADARTFVPDESFDAAFSNAALHWIPDGDQDDVLETVRDALVPGGRFVAEMGGAGNVDRVVSATRDALHDRGYDVPNPWYFPTIGEYAPRLETHGFEVRRAVLFDRPTELEGGEAGLRNWLGMFGDSLFADLAREEIDEVVAAVEDRLRSALFDEKTETWTADYRRLRFVAVRRPG